MLDVILRWGLFLSVGAIVTAVRAFPRQTSRCVADGRRNKLAADRSYGSVPLLTLEQTTVPAYARNRCGNRGTLAMAFSVTTLRTRTAGPARDEADEVALVRFQQLLGPSRYKVEWQDERNGKNLEVVAHPAVSNIKPSRSSPPLPPAPRGRRSAVAAALLPAVHS